MTPPISPASARCHSGSARRVRLSEIAAATTCPATIAARTCGTKAGPNHQRVSTTAATLLANSRKVFMGGSYYQPQAQQSPPPSPDVANDVGEWWGNRGQLWAS